MTTRVRTVGAVRRWMTGLAVVALVGGVAGCAGTTAASPSSTTATTATGTPSAGSATLTVDGQQITYQAAYLVDGVDVTLDAGSYAATASDEVTFLVVNGGRLTLTGATVTKSGDAGSNDANRTSDVSDQYNFYGLNSAIVVVGDGSSATVADSTIDTTSSGSNAVVAVDGGTAAVTGTKITTSGSSARGLHATYGGTITGSDLSISTTGAHCADVATDRGGGTVTVTGTNTFDTSGDGSPLVYSTGTISVSGVTGTASGSQAVVVEGKNSATVTDSHLTSGGGDGLMIYQSMSGDAADQNAAHSVGAVTLTGTTLTYTGTGPVFYFTNTSAELTLSDVTVTTSTATLASAAEDQWGTSGSNGADVTWSIAGSTLAGAVTAGSSSSIAVTLSNGAAVTGTTSGSVTVTQG